MKSSMVLYTLAGVAVMAPRVLAKANLGDLFGGGALGGGSSFGSSSLLCGLIRCQQPSLAPYSGYATCTNGVCGMSCGSGFTYSLALNDCVLGASGRTRVRKSKTTKPVTLCPTGESACPISGSASFDTFVQSSDQVSDFAGSKGGYECIDTTADVESCGGCASTGEGVDCTAIPGVSNVGCSAGHCVVFSCLSGHELTPNGDSCVKLTRSASRHHIQRSARSRKLQRKSSH